MERVSIIEGNIPVIVVAPHGYKGDDENTDVMVEAIASTIGSYAVINRGWERGETVDIFKDIADCNNIYHCQEDVVREEFLDPIIRFKNKILKNNQIAYVFYIHGMGNRHRIISKDPYLDVVVGYGSGKPNSYSCDVWQKNLFLHFMNQSGITSYEGKAGGQMSGWSRNNLNQYFRKWDYDPNVSSMQVEVVYDLRHDKDLALITADYIANAIMDLSTSNGYSGTEVYRSY
jgi:hypothetical protein